MYETRNCPVCLFRLGELIGIEYLFSQTGKVLQGITTDDSDELTAESGPLSDIDESQMEDDEGFVDEENDETIPSVDAVLATKSDSVAATGALCEVSTCLSCVV